MVIVSAAVKLKSLKNGCRLIVGFFAENMAWQQQPWAYFFVCMLSSLLAHCQQTLMQAKILWKRKCLYYVNESAGLYSVF